MRQLADYMHKERDNKNGCREIDACAEETTHVALEKPDPQKRPQVFLSLNDSELTQWTCLPILQLYSKNCLNSKKKQ